MKRHPPAFNTYENRQHAGISIYEWLLERAGKQGIRRAAGVPRNGGYFGRHGRCTSSISLNWPASAGDGRIPR
jgi:PII-like signaling protein